MIEHSKQLLEEIYSTFMIILRKISNKSEKIYGTIFYRIFWQTKMH